MTDKKGKSPRKPSARMAKTVDIMLENGGSVGSAMREAGYSEAMVKNPQKVTRSEAFQALMEEVGLTDMKLAERLNDGLEATKTVILGQGDDAFADNVPDYAIRHKYLETGLRLKGLGRTESGLTLNFNSFVGEQRDRYQL